MKALNHSQAQRLIHARLDGALKSADSARLSAHLGACQACRQYADQIQQLDAGLRLEFRSHALSAPAVPAHAFDTIAHQVVKSRAKMNTNRIFVSSLSFVLLLIVLAGGLSLLFSNRGLLNVLAPAPVRQPPSGILPTPLPTPTALPTPTPTPLPDWTIDRPLTSSQAIIAFLGELSARNQALLEAPGWLHINRRDAGQEGTIQTSFIEIWRNLSLSESLFTERLVLVKDQPDSENLIQYQVCLSDGRCGDLVAMREGRGTIDRFDIKHDPTIAGNLVQVLTGVTDISKSRNIDQVQAWLDRLDGKPVFVLFMHSSPKQPSASTLETIEVYTFDLESGLLLRENLRQVYPDGALFGETLGVYQYEVVPELPADVKRQYAEASAELLSFAAPTGVGPAPTATQLPESALSALDDLPYTQAAPLTDGQMIIQLLFALRQRLPTRITQLGWYVFDSLLPQNQDWASTRSTLLQVSEDGACRSMVYYLKDGQVLPNEITLEDGTWGLIGDVQVGIFTEAESSHVACSPEQVDNLVWLDNEIDFFRDFVAGKIDGEYRLWVEGIAGRRVLVLNYDIRYQPPKPVTMDPDTRALEPEDRSVKWLYFDLETGSILGQYEQVTLQNGKTFGEPYQEGDPLPQGVQFYENPPAELLQAFKQAVQDLRSHLDVTTQ